MFHFNFSFRKTLGVAALVGSVAAAQAGPWLTGANLDFIGLLGGHSGAVNFSTNGGSSFTNGQSLGFMQWGILNSNAIPLMGMGHMPSPDGFGPGTDLYTICGELQFLSDPQLVDAWHSDDGALSNDIHRAGSVVGANIGGITAFRDALQGSDANDRAVGFQVAVWAARYGGGAAMSISGNITVGSFIVSNYNNTASDFNDIKNFALMYYNAGLAHVYRSEFLMGANVGGGSDQDQFTVDPNLPPQSVPEPFTMSLGLAGAGLYIKKRIKAKKS